jgi:hypothetical protein
MLAVKDAYQGVVTVAMKLLSYTDFFKARGAYR